MYDCKSIYKCACTSYKFDLPPWLSSSTQVTNYERKTYTGIQIITNHCRITNNQVCEKNKYNCISNQQNPPPYATVFPLYRTFPFFFKLAYHLVPITSPYPIRSAPSFLVLCVCTEQQIYISTLISILNTDLDVAHHGNWTAGKLWLSNQNKQVTVSNLFLEIPIVRANSVNYVYRYHTIKVWLTEKYATEIQCLDNEQSYVSMAMADTNNKTLLEPSPIFIRQLAHTESWSLKLSQSLQLVQLACWT